MSVRYETLSFPYPADFARWYPYLRAENVPPDVPWIPWLQRVFAGETPGVENTFFAAYDEATHRWVGVLWCAIPPTTPELAHFGWFLVEEDQQGQGLGRQLLQRYLDFVEGRGVEMVMLPTQTSNTRAVGIYERRGWEVTMAQPDDSTRCWMVREPGFGYQAEYFCRRPGPLDFAPVAAADYVALDYLLCRPLSPSRLLPDFAGHQRFCSFVVPWAAADYVVARQQGRPLGLGVSYENASYFDAWALDSEVLAELLARAGGEAPDGSRTDRRRRRTQVPGPPLPRLPTEGRTFAAPSR